MIETHEELNILHENKSPRKIYIAAFLSIFIPGLGQVYNGQPLKGCLFLVVVFIIPFLLGLLSATTSFYGLLSYYLLEGILRIVIIIDGIKNAERQTEYVLKSYNTWYYYLLIAITIAGFMEFYSISSVLGTQTYMITISTANAPTIQLGDWVIADLRAYQQKDPDYGDIILFKAVDGQVYHFRVVGLPKDTLAIYNNTVIINGKMSDPTFIKETVYDKLPVVEFIEELPNQHKHSIYKAKPLYETEKRNFGPIRIPPNNYFVLGDNRDNAADSRYLGYIKRENILGRIIYSYMGKSLDRINVDFRK